MEMSLSFYGVGWKASVLTWQSRCIQKKKAPSVSILISKSLLGNEGSPCVPLTIKLLVIASPLHGFQILSYSHGHKETGLGQGRKALPGLGAG